MTGAGSATVAYVLEDDFGDGPGEGEDWIQPGIDITIGDLSVEKALQRRRNPDDPRPVGSGKGDWEGAISVSFTKTDDNFHDLVFADDGTALPDAPTGVPSAAWYFGVDLVDGDDERTPTGAVVVDAQVNYNQGEDVTVDLTIVYGDEPDDIDAPDTIQQPDDDDAYVSHGTDLDVDGVSQTLLQTATLSLSNLARFRRGPEIKPYDAVTGAIEPSFTSDATYTERDQLDIAVTGEVELEKVDGTFTVENAKGETTAYELKDMQPSNYSWSDLVNPDADLSEPIDYHVRTVEVA